MPDEGLPRPAPAGAAPASLAAFDGIGPNGTWTLYVYDDSPAGGGSLAGVSLDIVTGARLPAAGVEGRADPYPLRVPVSSVQGTVTDQDVVLEGLSHPNPEDLDVLLVAPDGSTRSWLLSDTGFLDVVGLEVVLDDEAGSPVPPALRAGTFQPTNDDPDDVLPGSAPPGPAPVSLTAFDGIDPNGFWTLYVFDDAGSN